MQTDNSPFDYNVRFSDHDISPSTHILHVCHRRLVVHMRGQTTETMHGEAL